VRYAGSLGLEAAGEWFGALPAGRGIQYSEASMKTGAIVLALAFAVLAVVYFVLPAGSLPSFFPGFEPGSARVHVKHGVAALAVAIVLFGAAWFVGRSPR
jgi:hypothetical protein